MINESQNDILMIMEQMATGIQFDRAMVFPLKAQEGFKEVSRLIKTRKLEVCNYRFIVMLCGRADLWDTFKSFTQNIATCVEQIREQNSLAIIVFTAVLPSL